MSADARVRELEEALEYYHDCCNLLPADLDAKWAGHRYEGMTTDEVVEAVLKVKA